MSKTTICKRARRKTKQAKLQNEKLADLLLRSDSISQISNIKYACKQTEALIIEARSVLFEKIKGYLGQYAEPLVSFGRRSSIVRKGSKTDFVENLKTPNKKGIVEYKGSIHFKDGLTKLPVGLFVDGNLSLEGTSTITKLPARLSVNGVLDLAHCSVEDIPDDINATTVEFDNPDLREKLEELKRNGYVGGIHFRGVER